MRQEIELITMDELEELRKYQGIERDWQSYDMLPAEDLVMLCRLKDKSVDLFTRRYNAAKRVINLTARKVGIDPDNTGYWLYSPDETGTDGEEDSPICRKIEELISRSGEKAQLKRRIQELLTENDVLRSLLRR